MKIHPIIMYMAIKDVLAVGALLYFFGNVAAFWWVCLAAWFYSLLALSGVIRLEEGKVRKGREEPHF
jgi:hypothetical protein